MKHFASASPTSTQHPLHNDPLAGWGWTFINKTYHQHKHRLQRMDNLIVPQKKPETSRRLCRGGHYDEPLDPVGAAATNAGNAAAAAAAANAAKATTNAPPGSRAVSAAAAVAVKKTEEDDGEEAPADGTDDDGDGNVTGESTIQALKAMVEEARYEEDRYSLYSSVAQRFDTV